MIELKSLNVFCVVIFIPLKYHVLQPPKTEYFLNIDAGLDWVDCCFLMYIFTKLSMHRIFLAKAEKTYIIKFTAPLGPHPQGQQFLYQVSDFSDDKHILKNRSNDVSHKFKVHERHNKVKQA